MTYEELVAETGAEIGIEGFAPDADGVCVLASDIGEIVIMDCKGPPRDGPPERGGRGRAA